MKAVNIRLFKGCRDINLKNLDKVNLQLYIDAEGKSRSKEYITDQLISKHRIKNIITPATLYDAAKKSSAAKMLEHLGQEKVEMTGFNKTYNINCGSISLIKVKYIQIQTIENRAHI